MSKLQESFKLGTTYFSTLLKRRFFMLSALLALSFAIGLVWGVTQPLITQKIVRHGTTSQTDSRWELKNLPTKTFGRDDPSVEGQIEFLTRMWLGNAGRPPALRSESLTATNWRIAGSAASADGQNLIVVYEGSNVPVSVSVGDQMPGGGKLMAISDEFASVLLNSKTVYLPMRATQK